MPKARVNGIDLYYETHGSGAPLLLIEGAWYASWMWFKQVPQLSRHFQLIVFDNRGVGRSGHPEGPYTTAAMADDAAGLLDALELPHAHVLGISMGGMIAQELALRHPDRVQGLVLGCTTAGGPDAPPPTQEYLRFVQESHGLTTEERYRKGFQLAAAPGYFAQNPDDLREMLSARLSTPQSPAGALAHATAIQSHNTWDRLHQIEALTLVAHGDADVVVDPANAALLAGRIPGAQTVMFPGAGHLFFIERSVAVNRIVADFLMTL